MPTHALQVQREYPPGPTDAAAEDEDVDVQDRDDEISDDMTAPRHRRDLSGQSDAVTSQGDSPREAVLLGGQYGKLRVCGHQSEDTV
jgi:hypothetical protein